MAPRKFFVGGNRKCMRRDWRGHEEDRDRAQRGRGALGVGGRRLSSDLICPQVVVSPPFVFLQQTKGLLRLDFAVAVQNRWVRKGGAFPARSVLRCW